MTPRTTSSHTAISNTLPNTFFSLVPPSDLDLVGIQATTALSNPPNKLIVFHYIMDEVMTLTVFTVSHVPCKVHLALSKVSSSELHDTHLDVCRALSTLSIR